jgi:agmatinase
MSSDKKITFADPKTSGEMLPANFMTDRIGKADVVLLGIPYEKTLSAMKGASSGPAAICDQLKFQVEDIDHRLFRPYGDNILGVLEKGDDLGLATRIKILEHHLEEVRNLEPERMTQVVFEKTLRFLRMNKFVVGLGGEHTVSLGIFQAMREFFGNFAVVQIDAHADLRTDTSDYDPNSKSLAHSTVIRKIKNYGVELYQLGIRSMSSGEFSQAAREGQLKNIFFARSRAGNVCELINSIRADQVYLTVDVDGLDPSIMPATGTPEPGGLQWGQFMFFVENLFQKKNVVGLDFVEVSQGGEFSEADRVKTAYNTALLVHQALCNKFRER